ncbi:MAG TPA: MFS transporter [Anaerolineaceae bacterium]|nr:MFS transporter [Anaerolineaceae bacterium]
MAGTDSSTSTIKRNGKYAITALVLLSVLNFVNQVDRRALVTIFPLLKLEWGLSDTQLGLAVSLFTLGRTLMSLPAGWLADRKGILKIMRPMVLLWSLFTILSGWAGQFFTFLGLRLGVGLMDGGNGPLDLAYLGKASPKQKRGIFLGIYSIALYLGSGVGVIYAGAIGERFGWRWVFIIPGIIGLITAMGLFLLPRHPGEETKQNTPSFQEKLSSSDFRWLLQKPLPGIFFGAALGVFASTALVSWLPTYLTRQFDLSLTRAGLVTGGVIIPASVVGTLLGAILNDRLGKQYPRKRLLISTFGLVAAAIFGVFGILSASVTVCIGLFFIASLCITIPVSPLLVFVQESVADTKLATTQAAFGLATQIIGAAPATGLIGILSDSIGLQFALIFPFLACGFGGLILLLTARQLNKTH